MIPSGSAAHRGARWDGEGVNFAVFSSRAEAVELCLFDAQGRATGSHRLPERTGDVWHGYLPGCTPGQRYGYRAHGPYDPAAGLRFNPHKLLIDPYALDLAGDFAWSPAVFDFDPDVTGRFRISTLDSAAHVPKSMVPGKRPAAAPKDPCIPWSEMIIYEANVRGYTMQHPEVPAADRGKFRGLTNGAILEYLKALGITSIELMPVHAFIDEKFLAQRGLRNFWGYNSINFFTPAARYAGADPAGEFRAMVDAIHDAGMEIILDVAYNHTGESDERGPTLSFRGLDNLAWYRTFADDPGRYTNETGCGNTLNADHPEVRRLVLESLRHWHRHMGVDGFRFDLATVLGRNTHGFDRGHQLLELIGGDPQLGGAKLIAEPWDIGPGGYQLGNFPPPWAAWNDRFRDAARKFWRGDAGSAGKLAAGLAGSADLFEPGGKPPQASINYVTAHDGFTLLDLVSYRRRHNTANGEDNRDGHPHNFSCNHGIEGASQDAEINALRRRQRLNLLATLLLSQGTPMLLAGDEFGHTQQGNNNAYCQDNETGWLDWAGRDADPSFTEQVRTLIRLRREIPLFRQERWLHAATHSPDGWPDIAWLRPDGAPMRPGDWETARALAVVLTETNHRLAESASCRAVAVLLNAADAAEDFVLPADRGAWKAVFSSVELARAAGPPDRWRLSARSLACLCLRPGQVPEIDA